MKYTELSKENLSAEIKPLLEKISEDFTPQAILFAAKGGFYLGQQASKYFCVPMFEAHAERTGGKIKKILAPVIRIIPKKLKIFLRKTELSSNIHKKSTVRNIYINNPDIFSYKKILFIDDSVDTGATALAIIEKFKNKNITIKTAALNIMTDSLKNIKTDYYVYQDTMVCGPWSSDSKENNIFLQDYYNWKKSNG